MDESWADLLYVYVCDDAIALSEERAREMCGAAYIRLPAVLWLGAELGVRTAALWWEAMRTRHCTEELRWVVGYRLEDMHLRGATETWPEYVRDALARMEEGREERAGGFDAECVAQVLLELSYNEAEREAVIGGGR